MRRLLTAILLLGALCATGPSAQVPALPNRPDSVKFAVVGDGGTGDRPQYEIARQMAIAHGASPFDLVLMLGDNFYGRQGPEDLKQKFDRPYAALLRAGVTFRATLGNHDAPENRFYPPLNMHGQRYYTFARQHVRFFALDTNLLDAPQRAWFEAALRAAEEDWKICYFHHPLYSSAGRHGSAIDLRVLLEPLLDRYGVQVVWSGHDHAYERIKPQKGIHYFVSGAAGRLRKGDLAASDLTAAGFDQDQSFMLVEVVGAELHFRAISRTGTTVDSGVIALSSKHSPTMAGVQREGAARDAMATTGRSRGVL
jgi:predicted MPP superfamily phosphohydrolase